ncbi:MAG: allantoate deiminase [Tepidanaerobacteraceae bacterium]|nr:allantoate deiminase [Tepidanaerobacteraceae bacterium]
MKSEVYDLLFSKLERIKKDIEKMASFTSTPGQGITRFSYTREHEKARDYIMSEMEKAGLEVKEDGVGNIVGRRKGKNELPPILVGSHIDSVKNGGAFDGAAGVVAGLELARVLKENRVELETPIEIVALVEEEGGRFGGGLFGSRAVAGLVNEEDLNSLTDDGGVSLCDAMKGFGLNPENIKDAVRPKGSFKYFLELHIEQGPVLERENKNIGVVDAIVGIAEYVVRIKGRADHAGTTPMNVRLDALVKASEMILEINRWALREGEGTVATVGKIKVLPGAANIVPREVQFSVDVRSKDKGVMVQMEEKMKDFLEDLRKDGFVGEIDNMIFVDPVFMDEKIKNVIKDTAKSLNLSYKTMVSGAGHDAMILSNIWPVGMIFVPSKDGRSHCPDEFTDFEWLKKGIDVMINTVLKLDKI